MKAYLYNTDMNTIKDFQKFLRETLESTVTSRHPFTPFLIIFILLLLIFGVLTGEGRLTGVFILLVTSLVIIYVLENRRK
jgi:hypothetical protein